MRPTLSAPSSRSRNTIRMTKQLVFKHNMSTDSDSGRLEGNSGRREHSGRRKSEGYHSGRRIRPGLGGSGAAVPEESPPVDDSPMVHHKTMAQRHTLA